LQGFIGDVRDDETVRHILAFDLLFEELASLRRRIVIFRDFI
jgi:hypothetical protein